MWCFELRLMYFFICSLNGEFIELSLFPTPDIFKTLSILNTYSLKLISIPVL